VRGCTYAIKSSRASGPWVSARGFMRRRKTFSGFRPSGPYGRGDAGPSGSKVKPSGTIREERVTVSASVDEEVGRVCLRVTTRTSEVDTIR